MQFKICLVKQLVDGEFSPPPTPRTTHSHNLPLREEVQPCQSKAFYDQVQGLKVKTPQFLSPASAHPSTHPSPRPALHVLQTHLTGFTSAKVSRFYFHMHYFLCLEYASWALRAGLYFLFLYIHPPLSVFVFLSVAHTRMPARTHT